MIHAYKIEFYPQTEEEKSLLEKSELAFNREHSCMHPDRFPFGIYVIETDSIHELNVEIIGGCHADGLMK